MSKYFKTKAEFDKWIADSFFKIAEQMVMNNPTDDEIIEKMLEEGYTDLDNLVSDGHAYMIGTHTNGGWIYEDEADIEYIKRTGSNVEIRKRIERSL